MRFDFPFTNKIEKVKWRRRSDLYYYHIQIFNFVSIYFKTLLTKMGTMFVHNFILWTNRMECRVNVSSNDLLIQQSLPTSHVFVWSAAANSNHNTNRCVLFYPAIINNRNYDMTTAKQPLTPLPGEEPDEEFTFAVATVERRTSTRRSSLFGLENRSTSGTPLALAVLFY